MQMRYHGANDIVSEHTSEGITLFFFCSNEVIDYTPPVLDALLYHVFVYFYKRAGKLLKFKSKTRLSFSFLQGGRC